MKNVFLLLLSVFVGDVAFAQGAEKKIAYVSENGTVLGDSTAAPYYRTIELSEKCYCYIVREYARAGWIRSLEEYSEYDEKQTRDGRYVLYYENGNLRQEGTYRDNKPVGVFTYYYKNGNPRERIENIYDSKPLYIQGYDTLGRALLTDGNGILLDTDDAGEVIYSKVLAHKIISCYKIKASQDTLFLPIEEQAAYPGGMAKMMSFLSKHVKYPRSARKDRIQGSVFASFVVGKDGTLQDFQIVKGISPECDAEVIRVLKLMDRWNPGIQRGKTVKSRFVLPMKFHF